MRPTRIPNGFVLNRLAEICNEYLSKATRVYIEGRMQTRQWIDQNGQTRYVSEVIASDMLLLDGRRVDAATDARLHSSVEDE